MDNTQNNNEFRYLPIKTHDDTTPYHRIYEVGTYRGVTYAIIDNYTHPCAYVENILHVSDCFDPILNTVDVHGGFTFLDSPYWSEADLASDSPNVEWDPTIPIASRHVPTPKIDPLYLGWDYAHAGDYFPYSTSDSEETFHNKKWAPYEVRAHVYSVISQLLAIKEAQSEQ